jgi:hypothetical protein
LGEVFEGFWNYLEAFGFSILPQMVFLDCVVRWRETREESLSSMGENENEDEDERKEQETQKSVRSTMAALKPALGGGCRLAHAHRSCSFLRLTDPVEGGYVAHPLYYVWNHS